MTRVIHQHKIELVIVKNKIIIIVFYSIVH